MVSYHHVQYKIVIKTNPIWRKFSEGRTDEQMDRQTVEGDFTGRCPTNVERPIKLFKNFIFVLNKGVKQIYTDVGLNKIVIILSSLWH